MNSPNRRHHTNHIHVAQMVKWVVITGFLVTAGLSYVYLKNRLIAAGELKKTLEVELRRVRNENESAHVQIAQLTSRPVLQRKLKDGTLDLIPISNESIVRLTLPAADKRDEIRVVSNELSTP